MERWLCGDRRSGEEEVAGKESTLRGVGEEQGRLGRCDVREEQGRLGWRGSGIRRRSSSVGRSRGAG